MNNKNTVNYLSDTLKVLEKQQKILEDQLIAQKNLEQLIPENLESNLNALDKFFPKLYNKFKNYHLRSEYKLTCNENRQPNILFPDGHYLYGSTPFDECSKQVEELLNNLSFSINTQGITDEENPFCQLHFYYKNKLYSQVKSLCNKSKSELHDKKRRTATSTPLLIMLGLGLGYQLAFLYEKFTPINTYIIEPDTDIFYLSLCVFDYLPLFEYISEKHLGIKFIFMDDPESIMLDLDNYCSSYGMNLAVKTFYQHYTSDKLTEIKNRLQRDMSSVLIKNGFFDDILHGMCHSARNLISKTKILTDYKLPEYLKKIPVLVIGCGSSLDTELDLIKRINDRVCIIACGTALTALIRYGIKVDIYVAIERTETVRDALLSIENKNVFNEILCIAPDVVHPSVLNLFKHKIIAFKANEVMYYSLALLGKIKVPNKYCCLNYCNPLVSNMGAFIAFYLGFHEIYFVGIDNGSAKSESHSKFSYYYDESGNMKKDAENMILNKLPLDYPGNFRSEIKTNTLFKISIRVFEDLISDNKKCANFYNASDGAKIEGSESKHLSDVNWEKYDSFDHNELRDIIEHQKAEKIEVNQHDFNAILKCERYNEIADLLIDDLKHLPENSEEIVLRLEAHFDYLNNLRKEGLVVGSLALYGSLALMYAGLITAIYCSDYQESELETIINTITDFITETKKYYPLTYKYDYDFIKNNIKR